MRGANEPELYLLCFCRIHIRTIFVIDVLVIYGVSVFPPGILSSELIMGIKVQRPRCFFDIGISNVLGKETLVLNNNITTIYFLSIN